MMQRHGNYQLITANSDRGDHTEASSPCSLWMLESEALSLGCESYKYVPLTRPEEELYVLVDSQVRIGWV